MQRLKSLCAVVTPLIACGLFAQQSQWVHPDANGHLIYLHDKNGVTIPDYSYAGYRAGGIALPTVPTQIRLSPTGADDTATIQNAINTISARPLNADGFRGPTTRSRSISLLRHAYDSRLRGSSAWSGKQRGQ